MTKKCLPNALCQIHFVLIFDRNYFINPTVFTKNFIFYCFSISLLGVYVFAQLLQELIDTGLYKCVRQFAMEIHMPGPLSNQKWLDRCRTLYKQMTQLNEGGWRLYNTTDNVRAMRATSDKNYSNRKAKISQLQGHGTIILWEVAFVNFDVQAQCDKFL